LSGPFTAWLHPAVSTIKPTSPASPSLPGEKIARSRADDGIFRQAPRRKWAYSGIMKKGKALKMKILKITVFAFVLGILGLLSLATFAKASKSKPQLAQSLLDRLVSARQKVKNFKCTVRYHRYQPKAAQERAFRKLMASGAFAHADKRGPMSKENIRRTFTDQAEHSFREHRLAIDSEGRARVEILTGTIDPNGHWEAAPRRNLAIWDGTRSLDYNLVPDQVYGFAVFDKKQSFQTTRQHIQPWTAFGGHFVDSLAGAMAGGKTVHVEKQADGILRVEIEGTKVGLVDPGQGYSVVLEENYSNGQVLSRYSASFTKVTDDVWFPIKGEYAWYDIDDPNAPRSRSHVHISNIVINDPNFADAVRMIIPKGTKVRDNIKNIKYVEGYPKQFR
jgi:hypothetical protein